MYNGPAALTGINCDHIDIETRTETDKRRIEDLIEHFIFPISTGGGGVPDTGTDISISTLMNTRCVTGRVCGIL